MGLVVNADDFGLSHEVNKAICQSFKEGKINRTTLMTNMPYAREAMEMAANEGFIDRVGIHLNLTSGIPLTDKIAKDSLMCNENGEFTADFARSMKMRFFLPAETGKNIEIELDGQMKEYEKLGGALWHIDSHHHVHTDPSVWKSLRRVLKKYPVSGVRLGRNMYRGGNPLMHLYKALYNKTVSRFCRLKPDYFGSMEDYMNWTKDMTSSQKGEFLTNNQVEIMVHPMFDAAGRLTDSLEEFPKVLSE